MTTTCATRAENIRLIQEMTQTVGPKDLTERSWPWSRSSGPHWTGSERPGLASWTSIRCDPAAARGLEAPLAPLGPPTTPPLVTGRGPFGFVELGQAPTHVRMRKASSSIRRTWPL